MSKIGALFRRITAGKQKPAKELTYVEKIVQRLEDLETLSDADERIKALEAKMGIPPGDYA